MADVAKTVRVKIGLVVGSDGTACAGTWVADGDIDWGGLIDGLGHWDDKAHKHIYPPHERHYVVNVEVPLPVIEEIDGVAEPAALQMMEDHNG